MRNQRDSILREETDELFPVTRWSMVMKAGPVEASQAQAALKSLCETYHKPISVLFKHWTRTNRAFGSDEWQDLTQGFFADMIQRSAFAQALPEAGRFRAFLCVCSKNYLRKEFQKRSAQRRFNLQEGISLEEGAFQMPSVDTEIPAHFLRAWLKAVKASARQRLFHEESKRSSFHPELFKDLLPAVCYEDNPGASQEELGRKYGLTREDVAQRLHRWRAAFRESVRAEILETVNQDHREFESEMRELLRVFAEMSNRGSTPSEDDDDASASAVVASS